MTMSKVRKHSGERARKRGEGNIYGVIDELIAPSFAMWIAARNNQVGIIDVGSLDVAAGKESSSNRDEHDDSGIDL